MVIGKIPEHSDKLPERLKKTHHDSGEIFQMILDRKIKENEDERTLGAGDRVSEATREAGEAIPLL